MISPPPPGDIVAEESPKPETKAGQVFDRQQEPVDAGSQYSPPSIYAMLAPENG
jgi:hypothetical protein